MANRFFEFDNAIPDVTDYNSYFDIGTHLVKGGLINSANCRPQKIVYPVQVRRPRVQGSHRAGQDITSQNPIIKNWSSGFTITQVIPNVGLGCQLMDASINLRWDTQLLSASDITDTMSAFITAMAFGGGLNGQFSQNLPWLAPEQQALI